MPPRKIAADLSLWNRICGRTKLSACVVQGWLRDRLACTPVAQEPGMLKQIDCHGETHCGHVREVNEDQFLIADLNRSLRVYQTSLDFDNQTKLFGGSQGKLLLVADGMGGHAFGRRASTIAVDSVIQYILNRMRWFFRSDQTAEDDLLADLKSALDQSQAAIQAEAEAMPDRDSMGTTVTMAYVIWPRLYVVHAGDSRCYLFRRGKLHQLTHDHTVAQQCVDSGLLDPKEAEQSRWSHVLWNVVGGGSSDLVPDTRLEALELGDVLLLCTDGLSKLVPDDEIARVLRTYPTARESADGLVTAALESGGSDNVTVVVARFEDTRPAESGGVMQAQATPSVEAPLRDEPSVATAEEGTEGVRRVPR
jgi:PPM family protein phosphatase